MRTPAGYHEGAAAANYACGEWPGGIAGMDLEVLEQTNAFVSHFERFTPDAQRVLAGDGLEALDPADVREARDEAMLEGLRVRAPQGDQWHREDGARGREIGSVPARCDDATGSPQRCVP